MTAELERQLIADLAGRREELVALASELIAFDTTAWESGRPARDEAGLQALLARRLAAGGLEAAVHECDPQPLRAHRQVADPEFDFEGRPQMVARLPGAPGGGGRSLLLCGHVDVVSAEPEERWTTPPRSAHVRGGRLYGRGACDMKGGVAALVLAAEALARCGARLAGDLVVCTVTDEEATGAGGIAAAQQLGVRADGGIIPEATGFDVWVACRGDVIPTIVVPGKPGHAGIEQPPWRDGGAVNAVEKAMQVMAALRELHEDWRVDPALRHPYLSPGHVVFTRIEGGEWVVTYPSECRVTCHVTYLPGQADADGWGTKVMEEFAAVVAEAAVADPDGWLAEHPPRIEWSIDIPAAEVPDDHPIVTAVLDAGAAIGRPGRRAGLDSWHDGATFTLFADTPTVCWGPRGIDVAHTIDEYVLIDDLVATAQGLAVAAVRFCGVA